MRRQKRQPCYSTAGSPAWPRAGILTRFRRAARAEKRLILLVAFAVLGLLLSGCGDTRAAAAVDTTEGAQPSLSASTNTEPSPGSPPPTTEPPWRAKQLVARAQQKAYEATLPAPPEPTTQPPAPPTTATTLAPRTAAVGSNGSTAIRGVWSGTAQRLAAYLLAANPTPSFTVSTQALADYYVRYTVEVGLRADVLWAQMLVETGFGRYGGSVLPGQNNYAGIGATGGGVPGQSFPNAEAGVKAHVAHMAAYVYTQDVAAWTNTAVDPRYGAVNPRGVARVLSDLDGRWAVPGTGYGASIERHVAAINR
jgi:hypothetical protein